MSLAVRVDIAALVVREGSGGTITGTLTLVGQPRPHQLRVSQRTPERYRPTTTVGQTGFSIRPYPGFLGALKASDLVDVEVELDLGKAAEQEPAE